MSKPRQKPSGKWEIALRHPDLPGGRKYFTFDSEREAAEYGAKWNLMKRAGLPLPAELMDTPRPVAEGKTLGYVVRLWANSGLAAPSQKSALDSLMQEVGAVRVADATYQWLMGYISNTLKLQKNLSPGSIRHRVQALGRSLDEYLLNNPKETFVNPVKLLPRGYSQYNDVERRKVEAAGKEVKHDVSRDRRLHPGEEERIVATLSGHHRPDKPRGLLLEGGDALLTMFLLIVNTGLRLKEAYTLTRGQVDMEGKVIRAKCSKQWRGKVKFREVPMRPEVHGALASYLAKRPAMLPGAHLFPFMEEQPELTLKKVSSRLSSRFTTAFAYAQCEDLTEHDLRHEATCRWLELRGPGGEWVFRLEEVNRIMGWTHNSPMAQRYASFRGSDLAQRLWVVTPEPAASEGSGAGS